MSRVFTAMRHKFSKGDFSQGSYWHTYKTSCAYGVAGATIGGAYSVYNNPDKQDIDIINGRCNMDIGGNEFFGGFFNGAIIGSIVSVVDPTV